MRCTRATSTSLVVFTVALVVAPARAEAQGATNKSFVRTLFFQDVVDPQESPVEVRQQASDSADAIAQFIAVAISTAPVVSSSAGFTYVRVRATGELSLRSESFGPTFAERPLTNGRRVASFGVSYQRSRTTFDGALDTADGREEGLPIFDNTLTFTSDRFVQYITKRAFLETKSDTFNFVAAYGLTDRFDVGVSVPVISMTVEGRTEEAFDITRFFNAGLVNPADRPTPTGTLTTSPLTSLTARGIGDVVVRLKYAFLAAGSDGVAVNADLRLPTGDEEELLGTGEPSVKLLLSASKTQGFMSLHANGGYTVGGLSDEAHYVVGTDAALLPRKQLTASFSFLGRTLREAALPTRTPTTRRTVNTPVGAADVVVDRFLWSSEPMTLLQVAGGVKLHVGGNTLINASVLVPINRRGFQPSITPAIGIEHTWGQ
jgi:hypothetical protein